MSASFPFPDGLLFVHIPKTAGTSFRYAASLPYGESAFYDYGVGNPATSPLIESYAYPNKRLFELGKALALHPQLFLGGHFPVRKYAPFFQSKNIILFLRDPIQRTISEYHHCCRTQGFNRGLQAFCNESRYQNVQKKYTVGFPLAVAGFVGLQEDYVQSLRMLEQLYPVQFPELRENINSDRDAVGYSLSDEEYAWVLAANQEDMVLYAHAVGLYQERSRLFAAGLPYVYGLVDMLNTKRLHGWAFSVVDDAPCCVEVWVNGVMQGQVLAQEHCSGLSAWNTPRHAYVGFDFAFPKLLQTDDRVECRVVGTGQVLLGLKQV